MALLTSGSITVFVTINFQVSPNEDEGEERKGDDLFCPTLDLNKNLTSGAEPVSSFDSWNNLTVPSEERMESPHSRMVASRRSYSNPSITAQARSTLLDLNSQIESLKRKLRKYEEGFEKEFGYKPSHEDKMANPDIKKMCSLLNKLRRQAKTLKEEIKEGTRDKKEDQARFTKRVVAELEQRIGSDAPCQDPPESLPREDLLAEKSTLQRGLLWLESVYGRPTSRPDRDLVRPLYDRYRAVKRALLRPVAAGKMKESISELGTIHEHEALELSGGVEGRNTSPPPPLASRSPSPPGQEDILENLHSLPRSELVQLHRDTREEKKRLRRNLQDQELEFQTRTGRRFHKEDRHSLEPTYTQYKNLKAKLKFLEALIAKFK